MKSLIKNYIDLLSTEQLKNFAEKNNIFLKQEELIYILNLIKENWEDILINEEKYFKLLENNINSEDLSKIKELYFYYKKRYKGYLF